jgi:two-component system response regulator YesN
LFKKEYNITPGKYVRERQLELAMRLLQSSDMQIQVIANQLGYSSAFAFSNAFKKLTGYSPREWRKINKGCFDKQY